MTVILKHNCLSYHTNLAKVMVSVVTKSHIQQGLLLTSNALKYLHLLKKDLVGRGIHSGTVRTDLGKMER